MHPDVEAVIGSSWREIFSLEQMRTWFAPDVGHLVIDVMLVLTGQLRVSEIGAHLQQSGYREDFLVLDDDAAEFPRDYAPMVLCDPAVSLDETR